MPGNESIVELDAVVLGAGFAGLYQLHQLRELGLRVRAYDDAGDVGGAWWWHYFPGAHLDTEGYLYQYLFSAELYAQWGWSERYPAGYEVQRWLRFVADRLDLRRDIALSTRVVSAHYDEDRGRWRVRTADGETVDTRFVISCVGRLPGPAEDLGPDDAFAGLIMDTARWPERGPDLTGRRVGVVGVGRSGVQLVPTIAPDVGHLTVFSGAPQDLLPRANPVYGWRERDSYRERLDELRATVPDTATGFEDEPLRPLETLYDEGSLALWRAVRAGSTDADAAAAYVRRRMRARLGDPRLVDALVPAAGALGPERVPLESGYLEVFGRRDVELVDLRTTPIARLRPEGIERVDGTVHELDVIVRTREVDAGPSALTHLEVRGRGGRSLADDWAREPRTTLGLAVHGYPNLFTTSAPLAPRAAEVNMSVSLQQQTEWITGAIRDLIAVGGTTIEATEAGEDAWVAEPVVTVGGHRQACAREAAAGYPAFRRT